MPLVVSTLYILSVSLLTQMFMWCFVCVDRVYYEAFLLLNKHFSEGCHLLNVFIILFFPWCFMLIVVLNCFDFVFHS